MSLARPPLNYDARWASEVKRELDRQDQLSHKKGQDVEVGQARLILTSPNGTRFSITVSDAGAISATPI